MIRTTIRKATTEPLFEQLFKNPDNYFGLYGLSSNNYFSKIILFNIMIILFKCKNCSPIHVHTANTVQHTGWSANPPPHFVIVQYRGHWVRSEVSGHRPSHDPSNGQRGVYKLGGPPSLLSQLSAIYQSLWMVREIPGLPPPFGIQRCLLIYRASLMRLWLTYATTNSSWGERRNALATHPLPMDGGNRHQPGNLVTAWGEKRPAIRGQRPRGETIARLRNMILETTGGAAAVRLSNMIREVLK